MGDFQIMLDDSPFTRKPLSYETAQITKRLKASAPVDISRETFRSKVEAGCTWVGGCYPQGDLKDAFIGQQVFAVDIDNQGNGKRPLGVDEDGYLHPLEAIRRAISHDLSPMLLYFTFSASLNPEWYRYRIVFDAGEPVCENTAREVIKALLSYYPEADQSCKNSNRLFFGAKAGSAAIDLWHPEEAIERRIRELTGGAADAAA